MINNKKPFPFQIADGKNKYTSVSDSKSFYRFEVVINGKCAALIKRNLAIHSLQPSDDNVKRFIENAVEAWAVKQPEVKVNGYTMDIINE